MKEFIKKPEWLIDIKFLTFSIYIREFIKEYNIQHMDYIDLNFLRDYYKKDKVKCLNLIDELTLRGFTFHAEKERSILPNVTYEIDNSFILVKENGSNFKHINFKALELANFLERFNVKDDYFFQYIKIDKFLYLNRNLSLRKLKEELSINNMTLVNLEDLQNNKYPHSVLNIENKSNIFLDKYELPCDNILENFYKSIKDNVVESGIEIEKIFGETTFNLFKQYCKENNLVYIEQLENFPFQALTTVNKFGQGRVNKIIKRYNDFLNRDYIIEDTLDDKSKDSEVEIETIYKNADVQGLAILDIHDGIIDALKSQGIEKIEQLNQCDFEALKNGKGVVKSKIDKFIKNMSLLSIPAEDSYLERLEKIKLSKSFDIYRYRSIGKLTLEQIAELKGLTRERIRQLEKKIINLFTSYIILYSDFIKSKCKNHNILDGDTLSYIFPNNEDMLYVKYALKNDSCIDFVYFKDLDQFLINKDINKIREKLNIIMEEEVPEIFNYNEELDNLNEVLQDNEIDYLDEKNFELYLLNNGYKKLKDYLWKGRVRVSKVYNFIIKKYFKDGIKINSENFEKIKKIAKKEFDIEIESDDHAIESRIWDENVLCDRGTYIHPDFLDVPLDLLDRIKDYINNHSMDSLMIVDVFGVFEKELIKRSSINNRYYLHGVLKYYYSEDLDFSRDSVMKKGKDRLSVNQILEEFLEEQGEPVSKEILRRKFPKWTEQLFGNSVILNKEIIYWNTGYMMSAKLLDITKEDKEKLNSILQDKLSLGFDYIHVKAIFNQIKLRMNDFYIKNKIKHYLNLYYILEYLFKEEYCFIRPLIFKEKPDSGNYRYDIFYNFVLEREIIYYDEFMDYFNKAKFNESTIYGGFSRVSKDLIEINKREYIHKSKFKIDDETVIKIKEALFKMFNGRNYIPLMGIMDYSNFPELEYEWTPYLLQDITKYYIPEFRIIEKEFKDRRYRYTTLVRSDSSIENIVDLIIYIIENDFKDENNMIIQKIQDFLITRNIIWGSIPYELWDSDRISIDEYGRVEIKEQSNDIK
ncbi:MULTISPECIES: sigma factor-like helix-turn-helix DNA-binding protein [unclassified Clostridium]|uniref:sigma factor-like helix-turn-helix DNA-binding protein n=1 Tax=unclassified Clostridium TaxID=2614128 RepID=UPI003F927459